jgi:hypothetical protein
MLLSHPGQHASGKCKIGCLVLLHRKIASEFSENSVRVARIDQLMEQLPSLPRAAFKRLTLEVKVLPSAHSSWPQMGYKKHLHKCLYEFNWLAPRRVSAHIKSIQYIHLHMHQHVQQLCAPVIFAS